MDEIIKPINNTKRYFISNKGYCFKVKRTKEILIPMRLNKGIPKVVIQNEKRNLIYLMIEHFLDEDFPKIKYSYRIVDNRVPLDKIKIQRISDSCTEDEEKIFLYKCREKANSQNARVNHKDKITDIDVLNTLKRNDFKCYYCKDKIKSKTWHLDHAVPLSKGGLNIFSNILPSCKECNLMKGALSIQKFLHKVKLINSNLNNN